MFVNVKEHIKVENEVKLKYPLKITKIKRLEKELATLAGRLEDYASKMTKNVEKMPQSVKEDLE